MGTRLKEFDFSGSRRSKYPWDQWQDGSIWKVVKGQDFKVSPTSFRVGLYHRAAVMEQRVVTKIDGSCVVFQFFPGKNGKKA